MELHWKTAPFAELSGLEILDLLVLRSQVFVVEQACVYLDPGLEDSDPGTLHMLVRAASNELVGYLRILPPGLDGAEPAIGRVLCARSVRGSGLGHRLMQAALVHVESHWPTTAVRLHAQTYLLRFYAEHGFVPQGEPYPLDGIEHQEMVRPAAER